MKRIVYLSALLLFVLLPGCSMREAVSRMRIELVRVQVSHMDSSGFDATVYLKVVNPNSFGMTISDFRYEAVINGQGLARGETNQEIKIPAEGSSVAELPLEVRYGELKGNLPDMLRGRFEYQVRGEAVFKTWFGSYTYPFDTGRKMDGWPGGGKGGVP